MSTLKADTIQSTGGGAATLTKQHAAKSWINFDGTGTPAARDSFNHASITDNGTGDYTLAFTNSFGNVNYACSGDNYGSITIAANSRQFGSKTKATGSLRIAAGYDSTTVGGFTYYDSAGK